VQVPFGALQRQRVIEPRARHSRELLRGAQRRGELRADADLDAAMELLIGSLFTRALAGDRSPHPWPERAVDTLLAGLRPYHRPEQHALRPGQHPPVPPPEE
jgi:hypothetical protein